MHNLLVFQHLTSQSKTLDKVIQNLSSFTAAS